MDPNIDETTEQINKMQEEMKLPLYPTDNQIAGRKRYLIDLKNGVLDKIKNYQAMLEKVEIEEKVLNGILEINKNGLRSD